MTVVADIINLALNDSGVLGVGQTPLAEDTNKALRRLNMMISQWNRRRWLVYHLVDTSAPCDGSVSYTVGTGGTFNIARPDRLEAAYIRQVVPTNPTPVDWPLRIIQSREEYSQITLKRLAAAPSEAIFYDSGYPLGAVYPWPLPNNQYELHLLTKSPLTAVTSTAQDLDLPPEYEMAIHTNFVNFLRGAYRLPPDPYFIGQGKATLQTIRGANFQVGRLSLPRAATRGPAYNPFSDRGN